MRTALACLLLLSIAPARADVLATTGWFWVIEHRNFLGADPAPELLDQWQYSADRQIRASTALEAVYRLEVVKDRVNIGAHEWQRLLGDAYARMRFYRDLRVQIEITLRQSGQAVPSFADFAAQGAE